MVLDYYKKADIDKMAAKFHELEAKHKALHSSILERKFATQRGDEFAKHGFLRRSNMLWRCVRKTFETIPPELNGKPCDGDTQDVTIFLHCFVIHVFGACDDLAWILACEKAVKKPDGSDLPPSWIGFRKDNKCVRAMLSDKMIGVLNGFEEWFKHIDDFRHSLAHRIPLYVPPYMIRHDREDDYNRLEHESWAALHGDDLVEYRRLKEEQDALTFFRPWFTHSFAEQAPNVVIHPQMLADFGAVLELGEATINEL